MSKRVAWVLRWVGRIIGAAFLGFVGAHIAGDGLPDLTECSAVEIAMFASLCVSLIGFVLIWRWELVGGVLSLAGAVGFFAINLAATGSIPSRWEPMLLFVPGVCALVARRILRSLAAAK